MLIVSGPSPVALRQLCLGSNELVSPVCSSVLWGACSATTVPYEPPKSGKTDAYDTVVDDAASEEEHPSPAAAALQLPPMTP